MSSRDIEIRPLRDPAEFRACQEVQRRAWGIAEDGYLVPVATLAAVAAYGGLVLGALDRSAEGERMVGFAFAFRGVLDDLPVLYSQLTGVLPDVQGGGVGRRIKAAQRAWARAHGLPAVVWAFDPLQAMNAHYNLNVLGAHVAHYHPDFYGPRADALNAGLPTDRLIAVWPTGDAENALNLSVPLAPHALRGATGDPDSLAGSRELLHPLLASVEGMDGGRDPDPRPFVPAMAAAECLSIEIPADVRTLREQPARVAAWQGAVRVTFAHAFGAGYVGTEFRRGERPCYILTRLDRKER